MKYNQELLAEKLQLIAEQHARTAGLDAAAEGSTRIAKRLEQLSDEISMLDQQYALQSYLSLWEELRESDYGQANAAENEYLLGIGYIHHPRTAPDLLFELAHHVRSRLRSHVRRYRLQRQPLPHNWTQWTELKQ